MSLTRNEWCMMWERMKTLELNIFDLYSGKKEFDYKVYHRMLSCVEETKKQIQQVIGQME